MKIEVLEGRFKETISLCSTATAKVSLSKAPAVKPLLEKPVRSFQV